LGVTVRPESQEELEVLFSERLEDRLEVVRRLLVALDPFYERDERRPEQSER
jgi:hypothetical protein